MITDVAHSSSNINIVLVQPVGYTHALALLEVAEYFQFKLEALGHKTRLVKNRFDHQAINLVLAGHLLKTPEGLPDKTIIFNSEQFGDDNTWTNNPVYQELLNKFYVWDYSKLNIDCLQLPQASLINIVYELCLDRLKKVNPKEYDLLFYGSVNPRRQELLKELLARGVKVKFIKNLYGLERDWYLERTRAVLNLHYYDAQVFQQVRSFYPLINGIPVVSEDFPLESAPMIYQDAIFKPDGANFVDYVVAKMENKKAFDEEAGVMLAQFKNAKIDSGIGQALNDAVAFFDKSGASQISTIQVLRKLNLGCGLDYRLGYLNVDCNKDVAPDLVLDFSQPIDSSNHRVLKNGNLITLALGQFDEIIAHHVLEQVEDLPQCMTNCLNLLKVDGQLKITMPFDLSALAWADPANKRGFNQSSWQIYTDQFWRLGWFNEKFELLEQKFQPSELGKQLLAQKKSQQDVLATPRAVDSMTVTLVKKKTTPEERTKARAYLPNLI